MAFVLWILAVILVVAGIFALFRKQLLWGIVLIVVGLLSARVASACSPDPKPEMYRVARANRVTR